MAILIHQPWAKWPSTLSHIVQSSLSASHARMNSTPGDRSWFVSRRIKKETAFHTVNRSRRASSKTLSDAVGGDWIDPAPSARRKQGDTNLNWSPGWFTKGGKKMNHCRCQGEHRDIIQLPKCGVTFDLIWTINAREVKQKERALV